MLDEPTIGPGIGLVAGATGAVVGSVGPVVAPDVDARRRGVAFVLLGQGIAARAGGLAGGVVGHALGHGEGGGEEGGGGEEEGGEGEGLHIGGVWCFGWVREGWDGQEIWLSGSLLQEWFLGKME